MQISADKCVFSINSLLKTSRPGKHLACIEFQAYAPDVSLCIVKHLQQYLKPHKAVSPDTVSRWIKTTLVDAGIDTSKYSAHSTRSASTSAAKGNNISIATIMKSAGWSQESTFTKFYDKPVAPRENFGAELLKAVCGDN